MQENDESTREKTHPATVAVLGPGGVGGLLAALFARAGHRVICLAAEQTANTLRDNGIHVRSTRFGDFTARVEADTVLREPVDLCVVTVKHTALEAALDRVPAENLAGVIVPLLNGVEHVDALRARYGHRVVPAVIRVESARTEPGVVVHGSAFAEIDLAGPADRLAAPAALLTEAGIDTRVLPDADAALWDKLSFLTPFALLTTRHRATIGEIRVGHRRELETLVRETAAVGRACGGTMEPAQILDRYNAFPAHGRSSMQRDAEAGRPLELDAIGGAVLRAAARHGIDAPFTAELVAELSARDRVVRFLGDREADRIPHPGGTLLGHLLRVAEVLETWGADRDTCAAGLCHAAYGTDGFDRSLLAPTDRRTLAALIGERAEALVYLYGSCDRSAVYPRLTAAPARLRDRFTGNDFEPDAEDLRAFMAITVANELDVLSHNPEIAAAHGPALLDLFERTSSLLPEPARRAVAESRTRLPG
ncbi:ketopantoate reductase family protein [Nocardia jejuensis]|uniref:ketopantoate reductase family protein n=1 Tax=Nocardia jejuensis TaxID=328049 RepID=UPI00082EF14D|nr:2-dehydropantoate 2-reductase [Nocardia jejuensis]